MIQVALILLALSVALTAILVARLWLRVRKAEQTCTVQEIIDMETGEQGEVVFIAPPTSRDN